MSKFKERIARYFKNNSKKSIAITAVCYILLFVCALAVVIPSLWAVATSLKYETDVLDVNVTLIPRRVTLENYTSILANRNVPILRWLSLFRDCVSRGGNFCFGSGCHL